MSAGANSSGASRRFARGLVGRSPALVEAYRLMRHPGWQRDLWSDLRTTKQEADFLQRLPSATCDQPAVLLGLYRDDIYETKLALILGSALRVAGMRPVVLVPSRRAARVARYARAFGIDETVDLEAEISRIDPDVRREAAAGFQLDGIDFDGIREWRLGSCQVGTHVLSTVIRVTYEGDPDFTDPLVRSVAEQALSDVVDRTLALDAVLESMSPRTVLVEEANYSQNGPLVDLAVGRGCDVIRTVALWRDDALMSRRVTVDNRWMDAKSVAPETVRLRSTRPWTSREEAELSADFDDRYGGRWGLGRIFQPDTRPTGPEEILAGLGLDSERPTVVVFTHVLWDASLSYGQDLFRNHAEWLLETARAASENDSVNWLFKTHPSNVFRTAHGDVAGESREISLLNECFGHLPSHITILRPETQISTRSLYEFCDIGVTVRGTAGLEMACFGKPVLTAGTGHYSGLGFTVDSETREGYLRKLDDLPDHVPVDPDVTTLAKRYAHALFLERPWRTTSFRCVHDLDTDGWHPLDRNVRLDAAGVTTLGDSPDLGPWVRWVVDGDGADYLPPRGVSGIDSA